MSETLSNETREPPAPRASVPHLVLVLGAGAPVTPSRHALVELDRVELGRGDVGGHKRAHGTLRIDVADQRASQQHAVLTRTTGRWQIADASSKNGTVVNGTRVTSTILADGDLVEIGRTFFRFVAAAPYIRAEAPDARAVEPLPGTATIDPAFAATLAPLPAIARGAAPVVILGATGTGKEVIARGIHQISGRRGPYVPVNCAAIPTELVASVLFGHRRGAFSGATDDELGLIRSADGGTLFLDEVGDLPPAAQAMLLRVLQEREVMPVGATKAAHVDLRVLAATHRDLHGMAAAGTFRPDLLHRLAGYVVELPALAARRDDLGLLVAALVDRHAPGRAIELEPRAARALLSYRWPGNIRELEQALVTALALAGEKPIAVEHLPAAITAAPPPSPVDDGRRDQLVALLTAHQGNVRAVARAMGKDPVQIRRWLERYGLDAATFR